MKPYESLTIEQVAAFPRPGTVVPGGIKFTPDGTGICYLYSETGSLARSLWRYDIATGRREVLVGPELAASEAGLSREEQLRRERARMRETGVTSYRFLKGRDELTVLVPMAGQVFLKRGREDLAPIEGTGGAIDPRPNEQGTALAFVRDGELHAIDLESGETRQLTAGAEPGVTNGLAEFIAQEELDRGEGYWWSRDGRYIAFERADERDIPVYPIVHQGSDRPEIEEHRYPFAGEANAKVGLAIVTVETGEVRELDLGDGEEYLARAWWTKQDTFVVRTLSRHQQHSRWYGFDPADGTRTTIREEVSRPWLNLDSDTRFLANGEVLRTSEASGFRHIVLDASDGSSRAVTSGEWIVTSIAHVDEDGRRVYFSGTREGAGERHLYRTGLDGGEITRLTGEPGWHSVVFSPKGDRFVDAHDTLGRPARIVLRNRDGDELAVLFEQEVTAESLGLRPPVLLQLPAADGTPLDAALYEPAGAQGKGPLVVSVYGGPHAQRVMDSWMLTVDLRAQYLAQRGIAVLKVDNRGSANRGLAFEAHLDRQMGHPEVADQVSTVNELARRYEYIDLERVGIYGWSYGGYMTLMCMLKQPELFRVGVAGAPVTDWDGYDTAYTERYMGTPQEQPDAYRASSVLPLAGRLDGDLLVVHGMVDENVHFRHTARLMKALGEAQRPFETLIFPEERHMPREAKGLEYQERRVLGFLEARLRGLTGD